jgi:hypothetical protein
MTDQHPNSPAKTDRALHGTITPGGLAVARLTVDVGGAQTVVVGRLASLVAHLVARGRRRDLDSREWLKGKVHMLWTEDDIRTYWEQGGDEPSMSPRPEPSRHQHRS